MITTEMIKKLRESTGAGMLDCKKALEESNGDYENAVDWLREKGIAKAAKKADRIAAEGLCSIAVEGNYALMCEINSETDFVAKNEKFINLVNDIATLVLKSKAKNLEDALLAKSNEGTISDTIVNATSTIGEKISLKKIELFKKQDNNVFGSYLHMGGKIGTLVVLKNTKDEELAKDIAMHIAAFAPRYLRREEVPFEEIQRERNVQLEASKNDEKLKDKPEVALNKIIDGKINKWFGEICLIEQAFVKDPSLSVQKHLDNNSASIERFVRYQVGEGIEKRKDNFAEEVFNQVGK